MVKRFGVFLLNLDENFSNDAKNSRPCIVISPDEMNRNIDSVIVAPISSISRKYPTRVLFDFLGKERAVVLDQIQTIEKTRLTQKIGQIDADVQEQILEVLQEMFAE